MTRQLEYKGRESPVYSAHKEKKRKSLERNLTRNVQSLWKEYFEILTRGAEVVSGKQKARPPPAEGTQRSSLK